MKYILILACLLTGCNFNDDLTYNVEPDLLPLVDEFYTDAATHGIDLVKDYNLTVSYVQLCAGCGGVASDMGTQRTIRINSDFKGHTFLKWIVYHELSHALLNKEHVKGRLSIMNPGVENNGIVSKALIKDLFTKD